MFRIASRIPMRRCPISNSVCQSRATWPVTVPRNFSPAHTRHNIHSDSNPEEPISESQPQAIESYVRSVRTEWKDYLPANLLTSEEYAVYERHYGPPVRLLSEEDVAALKAEDAAKLAEAMNDKEGEAVVLEAGTHILLGQDGKEIQVAEAEVKVWEDLAYIEIEGLEEEEGLDMEPIHREPLPTKPFTRYTDRQLAAAELAFKEPVIENPEEGDRESYMRTHPLTAFGRWGPDPWTICLPKSITKPTAALLSSITNQHLDDATLRVLGDQLGGSPVFTSKGNKKFKGIPLDTSKDMQPMDANVHLACLMPGYYAQALSAVTEVRKRLGGSWVLGDSEGGGGEGEIFENGVKNVLDVGTGGAGILAWRSIVEAEEDARKEQGSATASKMPSIPSSTNSDTPADHKATVVIKSDALRQRMKHLLPNTSFIPHLPSTLNDALPVSLGGQVDQEKQPRKLYDLIISTNTLLPIPELYNRKNHVANLHSLLSPTGVLVLIEKGSPLGFEAIAGARENLLKHHIATPESPSIPLTTTNADISEPRKAKPTGRIIAPCPHPYRCPLFTAGPAPYDAAGRRDWCRFPQRYERPPYLQRIIGARARNHADIEYSFVAIRRGESAAAPETLTPLDPAKFDTETAPAKSAYSMREIRQSAQSWPRVVMPPMKRRGHVTMDVCTPATFAVGQRSERKETKSWKPGRMSRNGSVSQRQAVSKNPLVELRDGERGEQAVTDSDTTSTPDDSATTPETTTSILPANMALLERWTVPRSFSKTAFRDARKVSWGDLWALGAKTRNQRNLFLGTKNEIGEIKRGRGVIIHEVDVGEGQVKVISKLRDKKGGRKMNLGKRERERREAGQEAKKIKEAKGGWRGEEAA